ncbi:hypothetical protein BABINDRAFT_24426, partial [Babjeviella inositovora NRRL Y-12698]
MAPTKLEIKLKSLNRLMKEESLYREELAEQQVVVDNLKANNADEYDLKKQIEVLEETRKMIPELLKKVTEHKQALDEFLESYSGEEDLTEAKEAI